jgi:putative aldouronate transport system substrate-binding protein
MRRTIATIVILLLAAGMTFATGTEEVASDDGVITITTVTNIGGNTRFYGDDTAEDNIWTRFLLEEYGINLEYLWILQGSGGDFDQKLNLSVLSGEVPDYFNIGGNVNMYRDFASSGVLMEVKPMFDELANEYYAANQNVLDGLLWEAFKVDGKNYSIPNPKFRFQDNKSLFIRQDWLDALGLEAPTTIEEMYEVAYAFTYDDPDGNGQDDTIGFGFDNTIMSWMASLDPFFGAYGSMPGTWLKGIWIEGDNGDLVYPLFEGDAKGALAELNRWYEEGIVNQDFVTQNEQALAQLVGSGVLGMYYGSPWNPTWPQPDTRANIPGAEWKAYALPAGPAGQGSFDTPIVGGVGPVFAADFEHFDRWIEVVNDRVEVTRTPGYGAFEEAALGRYYQIGDDGIYDKIEGRELNLGWNTNNVFRYLQIAEYYDAGYRGDAEGYEAVPVGIWSDIDNFENEPEYLSALRLVASVADQAFVDQYQAAVPGDVHAQVWEFLKSLEQETISKIIMGELPVSYFDEFEDEWRASGGDDLAAEINAWWSSR